MNRVVGRGSSVLNVCFYALKMLVDRDDTQSTHIKLTVKKHIPEPANII